MDIDRTIRDVMKEAVDEVNEEIKEEVSHILFANICIERFLEKLGKKK